MGNSIPKYVGLRLAERLIGGFCCGALFGWGCCFMYHSLRYVDKFKIQSRALDKWSDEHSAREFDTLVKTVKRIRAARSSTHQSSQQLDGKNDAEPKDDGFSPEQEPPADSSD